MKTIAIYICTAFFVVGCHGTDDRFSEAKQYVGGTRPGAYDSGRFFQLARPVYESKNAVSYLEGKATTGNATDKILACMLLAALLDQVHRQPTPQGQTFIREIDAAVLLTNLRNITTNGMDESWAYWYSVDNEMLKKYLEQPSPGNVANRAAPKK